MRRCVALVLAAIVTTTLVGSAAAGETWGFRMPLRLTYLSSLYDVNDYYEQHMDGYESDFVSPVALSFAPYYEFPFGLQIWGDLGPISAVIGDVNYWNVPLGLGVGFAVLPKFNISPYVKIGVRYPIANGDDVEGSKVGPVFAAGVEFLRKKVVGILAEVAYDMSAVEFESSTVDRVYDSSLRRYTYRSRNITEEVRGGLIVSIGAVF